MAVAASVTYMKDRASIVKFMAAMMPDMESLVLLVQSFVQVQNTTKCSWIQRGTYEVYP